MNKITMIFLLSTSSCLITNAQYLSQDHATDITSTAKNLQFSDKAFPITTNSFTLDSMGTVKDQAYYIEKSKNLRTGGLVLLGAGVTASVIGLLVATNANATFNTVETGIIIMGVGALSGIASIPLMIIAHVNRNKARLMLTQQKIGFGIPVKNGKELTGFTFSIPIGK